MLHVMNILCESCRIDDSVLHVSVSRIKIHVGLSHF
jgi:hypothetical protein